MAISELDLFLFTTDVNLAQAAEAAGITSVIADWERHGKQARQKGYDTDVSVDTPGDVRALTDALQIPVTVRVDALAGEAASDVERALDAGADILMLPMASSPEDVEHFLQIVRGRARTIIQIETQALVEQVNALRDLAWDHAYVGLNDLMISRRGGWIWEPLVDGTLDRVYETLEGRSVGFGGVTIVGGGAPLPFVDLLREMARRSCGLSFMRRTFHREIEGRDLGAEVEAVRAVWRAALRRSPDAVRRDREALLEVLEWLVPLDD